MTPKKGNMIDAVYWAEMMYKGYMRSKRIIGSSYRSPRKKERRNMIKSGQI